MWWLLVAGRSSASEPGETVTLRIAVPGDAGTVRDVAADGAAGQCTAVGSALHCPARGPVTFRWGPGGPWELVGDTVLAPGAAGAAVVWATGREVDEERLRVAPTADTVRDLFVRTGDHPVSQPSAALFAELLALASSRDAAVRRLLPDALLPYWRHTASDPFPADAPSVVPEGLLTALAADPDRKVRQILASRLRDLAEPGEPLQAEASTVLLSLAREGGGVERAAFGALAGQARTSGDVALATWQAALARVTRPGPPGRAAASTLAKLAGQLEPGPAVDPALAVSRTAQTHLEKVWSVWKAWRASVPFDPALAERLLLETEGLSPELVRSWGTSDPEGLRAVLIRWEPREPHSDRYRMVMRALVELPDSALHTMATDTLSPRGRDPGPE